MPDDFDFDRPGDELDDDEYPEPDDNDDETDTRPCPHCGKEIYDDVELCPYCGHDATPSTNAWPGRPVWWIILGLLGAGAVIWALAGLN